MRSIVLSALAASAFVSASTFAAPIVAVSSTGNLLKFDSASPTNVTTSGPITGLAPGESLLGIDYRPANGQLYGVGSTNKLYTINANTGVATPVGGGLGLALDGTFFGFDFNPVIDKIRVVSESDRNYVIDPDLGTATQVTDLFYGAGDPNFGIDPNVVGSAYTNNFAGTTSTQLFGIDSNLDILVTQANSAGTLGTVGPIGVNASAVLGLDIQTGTNTAFAILQTPSTFSSLYTINLATGASTLVGQVDGGLTITDFTIAIPEPTSASALLLAAPALLRRRKA